MNTVSVAFKLCLFQNLKYWELFKTWFVSLGTNIKTEGKQLKLLHSIHNSDLSITLATTGCQCPY